MMQPLPLRLAPGLYGNRSPRASRGRWIDGNLVRFKDGVPAQVGGWRRAQVAAGAISGLARDIVSWRPNDQSGRYVAIGTHAGAFKYDGGVIADITPAGFVPGRADTLIGKGFGAGLYGLGLYGTPRTTSGNTIAAGVWTFDLFGETLLGCFSGDGGFYEYTEGAGARMAPVAGAPKAAAMVVSDQRHVVLLQADGVPGRVSWSDREDRTQWIPAPTNRAGGYDLQVVTPLQAGRRYRDGMLLWTMTEMFALTPTFNAEVYGQQRLGEKCGTFGPHAVTIVTGPGGDRAFWLGPNGFFMFDGLVRRIESDLYDHVFEDINLLQAVKIQARVIGEFSEIWFFYPSAVSNEPDRAVIFNYDNQTWSKAALGRNALLDAGLFPYPLAIDAGGALFEHEITDLADGEAMPSFVESAPLLDGAGKRMLQIGGFWPDLTADSHCATLTILGRDWPGAADTAYGPYLCLPGTEKIDLAIETREARFRLANNGGHWELGEPLIETQPGSER